MSELLRRGLDRLLLDEQAWPEPRSRLNDRPGALFAAGSVGTTVSRRTSTRPVPSQAARPARPARPGPPGVVDSADAPTAEERSRRQRTVAVRELRTTPRGRIVLALRSPAAVRQAVILREVLDPPVALRERSAGQG